MKVKRFFLFAAVAIAAMTVSEQVNAQTFNQTKENNNIFKPHWYMQVQGGAAHTVGEAKFKNLISPAVALSLGYRFSPLWGVRVGASGWQAKGGWVNPTTTYKYNFLQGNVDATLDLSNLFSGFNSKRFFNAYMFLGAGLNGAYNNDDAVALAATGRTLGNLWTGTKMFVAGRGGLGANLRLSNNVAFNVEVNANALSDKFNSKKAGNPDWQFNALAGLTFKFGKSSQKKAVAPVQEPVAEPTPVVVKQEPVQVVVPVEEKKEEKVVKPQTLTENIFFNINSSSIRSSEEMKINNLVAFLKENPGTKVVVCGYADAATGNANINQRLSKARALTVEKALKAAGIATDRISVDFKGDKVQPFSVVEENRVAICVVE